MKTLFASLFLAALTTPAAAGPDFTSPSPRTRPLAASPASSEIGPLDDVVFATDSTQLTESAFLQIESAARWLRQHPDHKLVLEGYTDGTGGFLYNEDLATRRAFMVRQHLMVVGVSPDHIMMVVYGEQGAKGGENPLDRRVVLYATKLSPPQIAAASFDRKHALSSFWRQDGVLVTENYTDRGTVIGMP